MLNGEQFPEKRIYHGTTAARAEKIEKEGFRKHPDALFNYATSNKRIAENYAHSRAELGEDFFDRYPELLSFPVNERMHRMGQRDGFGMYTFHDEDGPDPKDIRSEPLTEERY